MGCQDTGTRIFEFVAKTQFLWKLSYKTEKLIIVCLILSTVSLHLKIIRQTFRGKKYEYVKKDCLAEQFFDTGNLKISAFCQNLYFFFIFDDFIGLNFDIYRKFMILYFKI